MADHQDPKAAAAATTTADTTTTPTTTRPQTTTTKTTPTPTPTPTPSTLSKLATKAKGYTKFWAEHVKKGEAPWTQWYCCGIVNGKLGGAARLLDAPLKRGIHLEIGDQNDVSEHTELGPLDQVCRGCIFRVEHLVKHARTSSAFPKPLAVDEDDCFYELLCSADAEFMRCSVLAEMVFDVTVWCATKI
ncbi:hypothetical protein MBM_02761 [Drepanopeziza brunnea f. sp. 'multigermtubi' MB_m1]|uniref:Uncharacterized protein n=1 Tax=Marssonina brunnea f. sp. multigermtubi (strain MB_m1) TaxID=1072389 RepID=K1Y300_MARBU|nr:uncharacterized protein MBM_02761 [Drepanopeziza brunnea f. sp. 'multigermtubi' MB_m1]EKD19524.1 hypothetical protein MBM_02761 [Drepanopeziza brunnea f. sp. 'multigermtubi' MB_m1]